MLKSRFLALPANGRRARNNKVLCRNGGKHSAHSFGELDDGFRRHSAGAGAAFFVKKTEELAEGVGAGGIPKKCAFTADVYEADLLELFEVMGKS